MDKRDLLLTALEAYKADSDAEIQQTMDFIKQNSDCFERTNLNGHVVGSAWILSPDGQKVLLTHHKKLGLWLQLGGHADGDSDLWNVALREATEESGIQGIEFVTRDIFDINIEVIPAYPKKNEPEHYHYDICFLLKAPTENFVISNESNSLKWTNKKELADMADKGQLTEAMISMVQKWKKLG